MNYSSNWQKYHSANPLKRLCLKNFLRKITAIADGLDFDSVLDAGCGEGLVLKEIAALKPGARLAGLDRSENSLKQARSFLPGAEFKTGDIRALPYGNKAFELVLALEVLEHLDDPAAALAELKRVAGRYCLISVPLEPWFRLGNLLSGKNWRALGNDPEHVNNWSKNEIIQIFKEYFKILSVQISFPWTIIIGKK